MAIAKHNGDWLAEDFDDAVPVIWNASTYGYGVDRLDDPLRWGFTYGIWKRIGPNQGKVPVGTFDSPQEVVAMIKLILASEEHDGRQ